MRKAITHDKWLNPTDKEQHKWVIERLIHKRILHPNPAFHHESDYEHALSGLRILVQTEEGKKQFATMKNTWSRRQNREKRLEKEHIKTFTFEAHRKVEGAINQLKKYTGRTKNNLLEQIILDAQAFKNEIKANLEKDYQEKKEKLSLKTGEKIALNSKLKKLRSELAFTQNTLQNKINEISLYKTLLEDHELLNLPLSSQQEERAWNSYLALMNSYEKQLQSTISDAIVNKTEVQREPIEPTLISSKADPKRVSDLRKEDDTPNETATPHRDTKEKKTHDIPFPSKSDPKRVSDLRKEGDTHTEMSQSPPPETTTNTPQEGLKSYRVSDFRNDVEKEEPPAEADSGDSRLKR